MKIAFVVHDYGRGTGQGRYVAELAGRFAGTHQVHVFANRFDADPRSPIRFHRVAALRLNALTTVLSFAAPSTFMTRRGFDIVHSQGFCCWGANVLTAHMCSRGWDAALRSFTGRPLPLRHAVFNRIAGWLEQGTYSSTRRAHVIAISSLVARDVRRYYGCELPTRTIFHGVDLETFSPAQRARYRSRMREELGIASNTFLFLFVGDLRKGAEQGIQALARMPAAHLLCVSRSDAREYRRAAARHGISSRVHFAGPASDLERFYAAADAFILPSPYDTFGMVALEAMASGLPTIVASSAGAAELIQDGVSGLILSEASHVAELAELMQALRSDRHFAARLGMCARRTAENYSWDAVARQTMEVYQSVLAARSES